MEQPQERCVTAAGIEFQNTKTAGVFVNPLEDLAFSDTSNIEYGSHFELEPSFDLMLQKPLQSGEPTMPEGFEFLEDLLCVPEAEDQFDPTMNPLGEDLLDVSDIVDETEKFATNCKNQKNQWISATQQNKQLQELSMSMKINREDLEITNSECSYVSRNASKVCDSLVRHKIGEMGPLPGPFTSDGLKVLDQFLRIPKSQQLATESMNILEQGLKKTNSSDNFESTNSLDTSLEYDGGTDVSKEYKPTPSNEISIKEQILSRIYPKTTALCTGNPVKCNFLKTNTNRKKMFPTSKRIQRIPKGSIYQNSSQNDLQISTIREKSSVFSGVNSIVKQQEEQYRKSSLSEIFERPSVVVCSSEKKNTLSKFSQNASIKERQLVEMSKTAQFDPSRLSGPNSSDGKEQPSGNSRRDVSNNERKRMRDFERPSKRISKASLNKNFSKNESVEMVHRRESRITNHENQSGERGRHISKPPEARACKKSHCSGLPSENKPREDEEEKNPTKLTKNSLKPYEKSQEESTKIQEKCLVSQENAVKRDSDIYGFRLKGATEKLSKEHVTTERTGGISGLNLVTKPLAKVDEAYSRQVVAIDRKRTSEKEGDESWQKQVSQLVTKGKVSDQGHCKKEQVKLKREFPYKAEKRKNNDSQSSTRDSTNHDASYKVTKKSKTDFGPCSNKASGPKVAISPKKIFETKTIIEESRINSTKYHTQSIQPVSCASSRGVLKTYRTPQDKQEHAKAVEILRGDLKLSDDSDNEPISSETGLNRQRTTSWQKNSRGLQEPGKSKTTTASSPNSETCKKVKESKPRLFTTKSTPTMVNSRKPSRREFTTKVTSSPSLKSKPGEQEQETQRPTLTPKFQQKHKKQESFNPKVQSTTPKSESQNQESKYLSVKQKIIATNYSTDSMAPLVIKPVKNEPNRKLLARLVESKLKKGPNSNGIGRSVQTHRFMSESNTSREKLDHRSLAPFQRKGTIDQIRLSKLHRLNQENNRSLEQQIQDDKENIMMAVRNKHQDTLDKLEKDAPQKVGSEDISGEEQPEKPAPIITLADFFKRTTSDNGNNEKRRREDPILQEYKLTKTPTPERADRQRKELIFNENKIRESFQFEGRDSYSERERHINSLLDTPIGIQHCQPGRPNQEDHPIYESSECRKQGSLVASVSPGRTASRGNRSGEEYARLENEMRKKLFSLSSTRFNRNENHVESINDLHLYKTNLKEQIAKENRDQWELLLTNSQSSQAKNKDRVLEERRSQSKHQLKILSGEQQGMNIHGERDNNRGEKQSFVKTSTGQHQLERVTVDKDYKSIALCRENRAPEGCQKWQDSSLLRVEAERAQGENRRYGFDNSLFGEKQAREKEEIRSSGYSGKANENDNAQKVEKNTEKELEKLSNWQELKTSNIGQGCMSPISQTKTIDIGPSVSEPVLDVSFPQPELSELIKGEENRSSSRKRSKEKKRKKNKERSRSRSREQDRSSKEKKKKSREE